MCGECRHFVWDSPKKKDKTKGRMRGETNVAVGSSDDPNAVY